MRARTGSYSYECEKEGLFTDKGQRMFLEIRDGVKSKLAKSGAITMGAAINGTCGSSWQMMACVDRMVELEELVEVDHGDCAGQHRIFRAPYHE